MGFSEVIGQAEVKNRLTNLVKNNQLGHALLLLGKEGSGALPLAIAFSQYLVCDRVNGKPSASPSLFGEPDPVGSLEPFRVDACGACPSCRKAIELAHPDIYYSYPVIPKKPGDKPISTDYIKEWRQFVQQQPYGNVFDWLQFIEAENKQGNITAQECSEIIHKLYLKSFESRYKILLMWMPEYLGNEGNKLLKLIEEPPEDTLFLLVAENESQILPTILSRTQRISVPALDNRDIERALQEHTQLPADQAKQAAAISEGNYREALQVLRHTEESWEELLRDWLNAILKTGPAAQVKWIEEMAKLGRERQKQFLRYFNHLLEQAIRSACMAPGTLLIPDNEKDFVLRLNRIADLSQQQAMVEELDQAAYFIERNANAKILFHALTIKLYHIIANRTKAMVT
jgi:DNA polymerase-3 subunit delta'